MLDPQRVRHEEESVREALQSRGVDDSVLQRYIDLDKEWRGQSQVVEQLKQQRNAMSPKGKPSAEELAALSRLSEEIKAKQEGLADLEAAAKAAALEIPNTPLSDVPAGDDEAANVEISRWGTTPDFAFDALAHEVLAERLNLVDFDAGVSLSGSRFVVIRGAGAKLERALQQFMLDMHSQEHGYEEVLPPVLIQGKALLGTGQLPKFEDDQYKIEGEDLWLSPTAEVQLTNLYRDQIIDGDALPISLTAHSSCFRKEAGSYGKDMKGSIRLHQFQKVELVKLVTAEQSAEELEALCGHAEAVLQALELPYRKVALCRGDLGFSSAKTYDLEVWFPSQNAYREVSSCSNFLDFQARRAMIRYRNMNEEVSYVHTLNGSGLAVGRTFAALLENMQQADGSVRIPKALQGYFGAEVINV